MEHYSGEIIVTKNFFLKLADQDFLDITGMDMYASVANVFSKSDTEIIKSAPEKLKEGSYSALLHLRRVDGDSIEVLAVFDTFVEEGETYIKIKLAELAGLLDTKTIYNACERVNEAYFDILGCVVLKYERSAQQLEIFYISDMSKRVIYSGSLDEWKEMLLKDRVEAEYTEEFECLCSNIASAVKRFAHTVKIRGFIGGTDSDVCGFKCRSIQDARGNAVVLGCIEMGNQEKMKNLIIDPVNDKDSFLDMLNKRAIIEHAKRILTLPTIKSSFFIIIDLDNFKSVNDVYGHIAGDEVLIRVTKIINESLGSRGVVGRVGGDEIFVVTDTITEQTELRNMLRSIRTGVEWAFNDDPREINVTCSIGVSAYPANGKDFDSLFELADKMLYLAKSKGKNRYIIYTPELHDPFLNKAEVPAAENNYDKSLTTDKNGIMYRLVDNYLTRHAYNNEKMFSEIGVGFVLSEILMVYENFTNLFQWTPEGGVTTDIKNVSYFVPDSSFGELFDRDRLLILDGLYKLDGKCPEIEKCLEAKGIKSAMFYRIDRMGQFSGYVMYARRKQRQMWSDYEIMALATAAKVFDVSIRE